MGLGSSTLSTDAIPSTFALSNRMNDELKLLISTQPVPSELDKFMETLLFSLDFSENTNHTYLSQLLQELSKRLAINNQQSHNFNRLLLHFIFKLDSYRQQIQTLVDSNVILNRPSISTTTTNGESTTPILSKSPILTSLSSTQPSSTESSSATAPMVDPSIQLQLYSHRQYLINYTILLQSFSKHFIETSDSTTLQHHFQGTHNTFVSLPTDLLQSIISFLAVESNDYTYDLHVVLLHFILILYSTEMYVPLPTEAYDQSKQHQQQPNNNILGEEDEDDMDQPMIYPQAPNLFLNATMKLFQRHSFVPIIHRFINTLYNNVIYNKPRPSSDHGLLHSIGNAASYLLLIPWNAYRYFFPTNLSNESSVSDLSLLTLLVLIQYYNPLVNPFRSITHHIKDKDFSDSNLGSTNIYISMSKLYEHIIKAPSSDKNILLLYYLLQDNPYFFKYVQSRTDIDNLVLPMLQILYTNFEDKPQKVYMILIIILILSQDTLFNGNVHSLMIHQILWYKERHLVDISLGGLIMIVLIKLIMINLSKLRDLNLHTNSLAILANLSSNIVHVHPYVASRLVKLLEILCKRFMKLKKIPLPNIIDNHGLLDRRNSVGTMISNISVDNISMMDMSHNSSSYHSPDGTPWSDIHSDELQTHTDILYIVLQIINNTLTYRAISNPHLIYSLLHQHDYLPSLVTDETLAPLSTNILNILSFYSSDLNNNSPLSTGNSGGIGSSGFISPTNNNNNSSGSPLGGQSQQEWTTEKILAYIDFKSKSMPIPGVQADQLRFKYEEESNSFEFITPYVWSIIYKFAGDNWSKRSSITSTSNLNQSNNNNNTSTTSTTTSTSTPSTSTSTTSTQQHLTLSPILNQISSPLLNIISSPPIIIEGLNDDHTNDDNNNETNDNLQTSMSKVSMT